MKSFKITEISNHKIESYYVRMTTDEVKIFLKNKRNAYGYIPGVGGDRSYDCYAIEVY